MKEHDLSDKLISIQEVNVLAVHSMQLVLNHHERA
jgi:hypothetical protein